MNKNKICFWKTLNSARYSGVTIEVIYNSSTWTGSQGRERYTRYYGVMIEHPHFICYCLAYIDMSFLFLIIF